MARRKAKAAVTRLAVSDSRNSAPNRKPESSLLDVVDSVLNKGVVLNGDLILGVANVDLIYAKLSVLLAALDRITKPACPQSKTGTAPRRKTRT